MAENERKEFEAMVAAINKLPEEKKAYFRGYAEGVAAMADQLKPKPAPSAA